MYNSFHPHNNVVHLFKHAFTLIYYNVELFSIYLCLLVKSTKIADTCFPTRLDVAEKH